MTNGVAKHRSLWWLEVCRGLQVPLEYLVMLVQGLVMGVFRQFVLVATSTSVRADQSDLLGTRRGDAACPR